MEDALSEEIRIECTRFSAFYSPLIATMAGGFLKEEGLVGKHSISPPGKSGIARVADGSVHVTQSAPSQGFAPLEQGKKPPAVHFAQINERDGFFLAARSPDKAFTWDKLRGKKVIVDHGGQPMAMFKYACFKKGVDVKDLKLIDAGPTENMIAAFRRGEGDYVHLLEPRRHARVARHRHGQALHARLPQGPRLALGHAGRRGGQGGGTLLQ